MAWASPDTPLTTWSGVEATAAPSTKKVTIPVEEAAAGAAVASEAVAVGGGGGVNARAAVRMIRWLVVAGLGAAITVVVVIARAARLTMTCVGAAAMLAAKSASPL